MCMACGTSAFFCPCGRYQLLDHSTCFWPTSDLTSGSFLMEPPGPSVSVSQSRRASCRWPPISVPTIYHTSSGSFEDAWDGCKRGQRLFLESNGAGCSRSQLRKSQALAALSYLNFAAFGHLFKIVIAALSCRGYPFQQMAVQKIH